LKLTSPISSLENYPNRSSILFSSFYFKTILLISIS